MAIPNLPEGGIKLFDFCKSKSQKEAALILGCSPGAVSQMLAANRQIFIFCLDDGRYDHYEVTKVKPKKAG